MSAEIAALSFPYPGPVPENPSLEDLSKNPLVRQFAGVSEEIKRHHSTIGMLSELCKMICESSPE
ncbi:hypothetical protein FTO70_03725 [Methanosarcina sp. KYL-1]|uniref:hypothetical protein n=1 Tax=Methanosarcina sp. KYL-1 TaxID=2602068 RepID=UPI0021013DFF|nr:hypothetical protein [Methanosarcina sp. KYL-1]MCQ1534813.1 hypothetical protein [Methanosarcina sp. KYL-1]